MTGGDASPHRLPGTRAALVAVAALLSACGVVFVHSTLAGPAEGFPGRMARAQILKALAGVCVFVVVSRLDYRVFARLAYPFYLGVLVVLAGLLVLKAPSETTARWIDLGFIKIQPSELMKVAVILALARWLRYRASYRRIAGLLPPYLMVFVPMLLVALQPDLGTSLMLPPILLALLFVAGAKRWPLVATLAAGVGSVPLVYLLRDVVPLLRDYQLRRLTGWFGQGDLETLRNEAFQLYQSLIALGSGGLTGAGLGQGAQNRLQWLPYKQTDFIFSIVAEEWGFVGAASVVLLYAVLVALCLRVALRTREPFGRLVAAGVAVALAAQTVQNIGMTMGLTPITGLPLPFVSFGGSSLVASWFSLGLVVSVARRPVRVVASADLAPRDRPRSVRVEEDRPAGSLLARWPV